MNNTIKAGENALADRFRRFDDALAEDAALDAPTLLQESLDRILRLVDRLPQREAIERRHAERWTEAALAMAEERLTLERGADAINVKDLHTHVLWHLRRASGIGGSEAGLILRHFRGDSSGGFGNIRNLALEKLLVLAPRPPSPEMERGVRAEPWVRRILQEESGAVTEGAALTALRGFRWSKAPFLVGTPDDILRSPETGALRIVDYKAPSAEVCKDYETSGIAPDYVAQLHHYLILARAAGIRVEGLSVEVLDPRHFKVTSYPVEIDPALGREILGGARRFWTEAVMQGVAPDPVKAPELAVDNPVFPGLFARAALYRVLKDMIEQREKECIERISLLAAREHALATGRMNGGPASFSRNRTWDEAHLRDLAEACGIPLEDYEKPGKAINADRACLMIETLCEAAQLDDATFLEVARDVAREGVPMKKILDCNALADRLVAEGVDPSPAAGIRESFMLTRKKSGPEVESLLRLREQAEDLADAMDEVVVETTEKILRDEIQEQDPDMKILHA